MIFEYQSRSNNKMIENPTLETILKNLYEINSRTKSFFTLSNDSGDFVQCAGEKLRLTIEYKHNKNLGTLGLEEENKEPTSINCSVGPITVQKNEVLTINDAINVFETFYKTGEIPTKYELRQWMVLED
ncbi:hypothetical protein [Pseudoneobacillus sp. C159]